MSRIVAFFTKGAFFLFTSLTMIAGGACTEKDNNSHQEEDRPFQRLDEAGFSLEGKNAVIDANNQFALEFYSHLKEKEREKNIFFSPYSISAALMMAYEGARGETAEEIRAVFHFPEDAAIRRANYAAIYNQLNPREALYELSTANAFWVNQLLPLQDDYKDTLVRYYGGEANSLNFRSAAEEARQIINNWVEERTNNKIQNLFPPNSLHSNTQLVLTNAIYFKGIWELPFDESMTEEEDFRVNSGQTVQASMMQMVGEGAFHYIETEELQILEMLYEGEALSMLVLLPKDDDIASLERILTVEKLNSWRAELEKQRVDIYLPKFTFKTDYSLGEQLEAMGMLSPFNPDLANFSGITGGRDLYIDLIIHKAFVNVNEEGSEAAAATGVSFGPTSAPPSLAPVFRADHPFIFIISKRGGEGESANILFLGRVNNPT